MSDDGWSCPIDGLPITREECVESCQHWDAKRGICLLIEEELKAIKEMEERG